MHRLRRIRSAAQEQADDRGAIAAAPRAGRALHAELVRNGLVAWTSGNVSARVPGEDLMVIKPSGVSFDDLTPDAMVVCDLDGSVVEGDLAPSSDTATHAYVYRDDARRGRRGAHPQRATRRRGPPAARRSRAC